MEATQTPKPKNHWILKLSWRFFTGAHLDGRARQHRNGSVLPRYRDYYWNRYSRSRRALIRNLCFWIFCAFLFGAKIDWADTKFAVLCVLPFLAFRVWRKVVNIFTMQTRFTDSDQRTETYRIVRPVWRKRIARIRPPKIRWNTPDGGTIPPEMTKAILAENAEDGGSPITSLRMMQDPDKPSSRTKTIMRHHKRKNQAS